MAKAIKKIAHKGKIKSSVLLIETNFVYSQKLIIMKSLIKMSFVCMLLAANNLFAEQRPDSTGLPGDNFSLQGALQMFKESKSLDEFEKKLNTTDNHVNNLDLDGDNKTDYIRVVDKSEGTSHAIVLKDDVNKDESQDVAVIEIEKNGKESAMLQIVGDKELYGDSTFVEPIDQSEIKSGQKGPSASNLHFIFVNVWLWPCVGFIYEPYYVPWVSPWRWHYYPVWWSPWYPLGWGVYHPYCMYYHSWYRPVYEHRVMVADGIYQPYRTTSPYVVNRYQPAHAQYNAYKQNHFQKPINSARPVNNQKSGNNIKMSNPASNKQMMNHGNGNNQGHFKQGNNKPVNENHQLNNKSGNEKPGNVKQSKGGRKQAKQDRQQGRQQTRQNKQGRNK